MGTETEASSPGTSGLRHSTMSDEYSCSGAVACVLVEAGGVLTLDGHPGEHAALTPELVARNEVLSRIAESATEGAVAFLPISQAMAAAWRAAVAAQPASEALLELGVSAKQLVLTLAVRCPEATTIP